MSENILFTSREISGSLYPIARKMVPVGLRTHGLPLAHQLSLLKRILAFCVIPVISLDFRSCRDGIDGSNKSLSSDSFKRGISHIIDKIVILVDGVLSTGKTISASKDTLVRFVRPEYIQSAILVGHDNREIPIKADYIENSNSSEYEGVPFYESDK